MPADLQRLGKYEIASRIGEGGMAIVYRARLRGPAQATREVALKVIRPHLSEQEDFILMFLDEMRVAMALTHRNIVQTFDGGHDEGHHFLVMELVDGCSLAQLLRRSAEPLPLDLVLFIGMEICAALDFAHGFCPPGEAQPGVVHRDVSLSNILVSRQGDVKLADFGVAKAAGRLAVTSTDLIKGKLDYMAPEQALGEVEPRSDLFALGAVLYRLIGGESIRTGASLESVRLGTPIRPRLAALRPGTPPAIEALVMSCLAAAASARPSSAAALREALAGEALALQLDAGHGPDPHARLRRYLEPRLHGGVPAARPVSAGPVEARPAAGGAEKVARALLAQARAEPEEPTRRRRPERSGPLAGETLAPIAAGEGTDLATLADEERTSARIARGPGRPRSGTRSALVMAALLLGLGGLAVWLAWRSPVPDRPAGTEDRLAEGAAARPAEAGAAPPDGPVPGDGTVSADGLARLEARAAAGPAARPRRRRNAVKPAAVPLPTLWVMARSEGRMIWAEVSVDGRRVGEAPLRLQLSPGQHLVEVRRDGFRAVRRSLTLTPARLQRAFFDLERTPLR